MVDVRVVYKMSSFTCYAKTVAFLIGIFCRKLHIYVKVLVSFSGGVYLMNQ